MAGVVWYGREVGEAVRQACYWGLLAGAKHILVESRAEVPYRTGTLQRSSAITVGRLPPLRQVFEAAGAGKRPTGREHSTYFLPRGVPRGDSFRLFISYNTPYARRMHEHPEYRFRHGRKAHYLRDPFNRNVPDFVLSQVERHIRVALARIPVRRARPPGVR